MKSYSKSFIFVFAVTFNRFLFKLVLSIRVNVNNEKIFINREMSGKCGLYILQTTHSRVLVHKPFATNHSNGDNRNNAVVYRTRGRDVHGVLKSKRTTRKLACFTRTVSSGDRLVRVTVTGNQPCLCRRVFVFCSVLFAGSHVRGGHPATISDNSGDHRPVSFCWNPVAVWRSVTNRAGRSYLHVNTADAVGDSRSRAHVIRHDVLTDGVRTEFYFINQRLGELMTFLIWVNIAVEHCLFFFIKLII